MHVRLGPLDLTLDHVAFTAADIDRAHLEIREIGLACTSIAEATWPGESGPEHAPTLCIVLSDGYIDVIESSSSLDRARSRPATALAPSGVILGCDDLEDTRQRLLTSGIRCGRPYTIDRVFRDETPDQHYEIFGTSERHPSGLAMAVIRTMPGPPMANDSEFVPEGDCVEEVARRLGCELGFRAMRPRP